jgi:hypothetical protein
MMRDDSPWPPYDPYHSPRRPAQDPDPEATPPMGTPVVPRQPSPWGDPATPPAWNPGYTPPSGTPPRRPPPDPYGPTTAYPQWREPRQPPETPQSRGTMPPWPASLPEQSAPTPPEYAAPSRTRPREHRKSTGWSLPIEHIVLGMGIVGMLLALSQPWGVDARGHLILLSATSRQIAGYTVGGFAVLGGLLALLNRRMGCLAMIGCLGLFIIPILAAAAIGGFEILTQVHVIPHLTPAGVHQTNRGFFLWWGGLAVTLAGLLLEVVTHRRKSGLGI